MNVNMEKEKIMNMSMSNSSQGTTKEMPPHVPSRHFLPVMDHSTKSPS